MTKPGFDLELEHVKAPGPNIFAWHPSARYLMGFNQLSSICDAGGPLPSSLRIPYVSYEIEFSQVLSKVTDPTDSRKVQIVHFVAAGLGYHETRIYCH